MTEPTIICPKCKGEIPLTQSLAAPLIEATKRDYEVRLARQAADMVRREEAVAKARETLDAQVAATLKQERGKIAAEEAAKAKRLLASDLDQKSKENAELQDVLKQRETKLADALKAQADLSRQKRELEEAKRELGLAVEKQVQEALAPIRDKARKEAEEQAKLKVMEREETIASMKKQIEDLKRKAEQGSQQLQGEVQELELEGLLRAKFPLDTIAPVPKGEHGGDVVQKVMGPLGQSCGAILWESKRTKGWSDGWLPKLRDDQRAAKADVAVIVSQALPKGVETFDGVDGVWITHPRTVLPVATMLRHALLEVASARKASEGQQTKMELLYQYLTGPGFRHRVQAIVEAFSTMQEDLLREKKALLGQWAKREKQIENVMQATVGMYGDLQGIAGKTLQAIDGLERPALDGPSAAGVKKVSK